MAIGRLLVPSKSGREVVKLEREVHSLILELVKDGQASGEEKNLLQAILNGAKGSSFTSQDKADAFIVDNCKSIYFAGHETTATAASWCLLLLALYPEWQHLVRSEITQLCGGLSPDAQSLQKMKIVKCLISLCLLVLILESEN